MAKNGLRRCDALLASQRKVETSAHAVAVNSSDGWGGESGNSIHEPLTHLGKAERFGPVELGDFMEVGAGREEVRVAGEDESAGGCCASCSTATVRAMTRARVRRLVPSWETRRRTAISPYISMTYKS
jgi:hypothetical protein